MVGIWKSEFSRCYVGRIIGGNVGQNISGGYFEMLVQFV